jgi:hypothetical protein
MNVPSRRLFLSWKALTLMSLMFAPALVDAQTADIAFRVDTDVFTDLNKAPIKSSITIFSSGTYYDFAADALGVITIYNSQKQTITLLDPKRKLQMVIEANSLQREINDAAKQAKSEMKEVTIEQVDTASVTVGNKELVYEVTTSNPPMEGAAKQFAEFASWSARLNGAYPPKLPPYIRLHLNDVLASNNRLPEKIVRKTSNQNAVYSISTPVWQLDADSNKRIEKALAMSQTFLLVSADRFW